MNDYKEYINKNCKIIPFACSGTIIGVYITGKGIEFQVRYYMNGEQKTDYFFEWEILFPNILKEEVQEMLKD